MQTALRTILIVGGGFSGTVLAANLLRRPPVQRTRIVLVERQPKMGCGVAYASRAFPYLLNVPAARMSADCDDPGQFVEFARRRLPGASASSFLPRQLYGDYLRDRLRNAELTAPGHVRLERLQAEVRAVRAVPESTRLLVSMSAIDRTADQVVLACGDPAPRVRDYAADVAGHPAYVCDPYDGEPVRATDRVVLLIGTGLTMIDVAVAVAAKDPALRIIALSRHGLLPQVQREVATVMNGRLNVAAQLESPSLRRVMASVRQLVESVQRRGGDWREAIGRVREIAPRLWRSLDDSERRRFLRHARVYWDVHRHRMPPAIAERVQRLLASGQLQVRAGSVQQLCADGERIVALWRPRGRLDSQEIWVDRVVDCSGPDQRLQRSSDGLWRQLLDAGLVSADAAGLGVRTAAHGALLGSDGYPSGGLFYLGPMLRADQWEATAVGELRQRACELATMLAAPARTARLLQFGAMLPSHRGCPPAPNQPSAAQVLQVPASGASSASGLSTPNCAGLRV